MSPLNITLRETSQAALPTLKGDNHVLWAYDGELAELPWRESLLEQAQALALQAGDSADLFAQECGAPVGNHDSSCVRLSRCWGLLVTEQGTDASLKAAAVAQGSVRAGWHESCDGLFLVLGLELPRCQAVEGSVDAFTQEQLKVRCLRQYETLISHLVHQVEGVEQAQAIELEFLGDWDESTRLLQRRLSRQAVSAWAQQRVGQWPALAMAA